MATPQISNEELLVTVEAYNTNDRNQVRTSAALGCSRGKVQDHLRQAAQRGLLLSHPAAMPGFQIKSVASKEGDKWIKQTQAPGEQFAMPDGHMLKGVSALLDGEGRVIQEWRKTKIGELDPLQIAEQLKAAFADYAPAAPIAPFPAEVRNGDLLTIFPANDWHIGMFAWGKETGANWDLKIAEEAIGRAAEDTIARAPGSAVCVVLGGGDLLHADNSDNQTARSGNQLDVDGRYPKVVESATRVMVRTIDAALRYNSQVIVRILPGNHDEHSAIAVAYFLLAWYRNDARVIVDADPSLFWWYRFGACLFGATHGHTVKIAQMPGIMAHRRAEDWGATKFRYVHGFHLHHSAKVATEGNGVICEVHQAPIPQDAWHYGAGFLSGRSMQAITYHREFGEIGRVRTAILDGEKPMTGG